MKTHHLQSLIFASAAEAEQLDAFEAQLAKVVAAVRERGSN
jgi:hypothetical protein